jgi:diguanylate cyclase (GGDEF)-like protein
MGALFALTLEPISRPDIADVLSESFLFLLVVALILIVAPASITRRTRRTLITGFGLLGIGTLQDVFDELYSMPHALGLFENIGLPAGLIIIAVGLYGWAGELRSAYASLERHKRQLERISTTDELTDLFNARHFDRQLKHELERAHRYERPLSLLFLDIDDFKQYNDTHGHLAGNAVLRTCASIISNALRRSDQAYRFGGEEFTVILPETGMERAEAVAMRIREQFQAHAFYPGDRGPVHITISIGVAECQPTDSASALIDKADSAMYEAKMRGKNRVVQWQP